MQKFFLAEIITKDKLIHQGLFFRPQHPSKKAILWIHGLTDTFYGDVRTLETFAEFCDKEGYGFASFNTRGHDMVTGISKRDAKSPKGRTSISGGSSYEIFEDSRYDIAAGIDFLVGHGFSDVILVGHSTGANKVCYFAGTQKDTRVKGIVFVSPLSDVPAKLGELKENYIKTLCMMKKFVRAGKGETLLTDVDYMPLTPKRFLSLYTVHSPEDVFPYHQKKPSFTTFANIHIPLFVVMAGSDEYTDRPVSEILDTYQWYQRSSNYKGVVIPKAFHSFDGKEKEFVGAIIDWIKTI